MELIILLVILAGLAFWVMAIYNKLVERVHRQLI